MEAVMQGMLILSFVSIFVYSNAARITSIQPHYGSLHGHTLVTIVGEGFAEDRFNFGAGSEHLGNKVKFVSSTRSYTCDIFDNGCHERQLQCYTRAMPGDHYYVRVTVNGDDVPLEQHCRWENDNLCKLETRLRSTPLLSFVEPSSAAPGSILKIHGKILTTRVFSSDDASMNGRIERIRRVYFGQQSCNLISDELTNELYGIELNSNNRGYTDDGWFKCKLDGSYVGNTNVSFIIEGEYGRSLPDLSTLHISNSGQIHMFQSYAVINNIVPNVGSLEGGTELHIEGNYFDDGIIPAKVFIDDDPCEIIKPVTLHEIVCKTPSKPQDQEYYSGNRGVWVDLWNEVNMNYMNLPAIWNYTTTTNPLYNRTWFDGAGYQELTDNFGKDNYAIHTQGYFIPPHDGDYVFYLLADDMAVVYFSESQDPNEKAKILECSQYCPTYDVFNTQKSRIFSLAKGNKYYFETLGAENSQEGYIRFGVRTFVTNYLSSQSGDVLNEEQVIRTHSTVLLEQQSITLRNWSMQTTVNEVQTIDIVSTNGVSDAEFRLGLAGAWTRALPLNSDGSTVAEALNSLPSFLTNTIVVSKVADSYILTFIGDMGDVPEIEVTVQASHLANISILETVKGSASRNSFQLELDGVPSPQISYNATAEEVKDAIKSMFSVRCPTQLDGSSEDIAQARKYHFDFEDASEYQNRHWGYIVRNSEPFCGKGSLRGPQYVFKYDQHDLDVIKLNSYPMICFAYKGSFQQQIGLRINYRVDDGRILARHSNFPHEFENDNSWHYTCINLLELATSAIPVSEGLYHKMEYLRMYPLNSDTYIDEVDIRETETITSDRWTGIAMERLQPPLNMLLYDAYVSKTDLEYKVWLSSFNCEHDLPLFGVFGAEVATGSRNSTSTYVVYDHTSWSNSSSVSVERIQAASPPISGYFNLTYMGETIQGLPADIEAEMLETYLRNVDGMGYVDVTRKGSCIGYNWTVQWTDVGGHHNLPHIDGSGLVGNNVSISTWSEVEGGVLYEMIPGEMVRTVETVPQVTVYINDIPTACIGNCSFQWQEDSTPTITSVDPNSGSSSASTVLTVQGTNLEELTNAVDNSTISIGGSECVITSHSDSDILCDVGNGPLGTHNVIVKIAGKGLARYTGQTQQFSYSGEVNNIYPTAGSYGGNIRMTIIGSGFANESEVTVGGEECAVINYNYTVILCLVPAKITSNPDISSVIVTHPSGDLTSPVDFYYNITRTPVVYSINVTESLVLGGEIMAIVGSNLKPTETENMHILLGLAEAEVLSYSNNEITVLLPPNGPGHYKLVVNIEEIGYADVDTYNIALVNYTLSVDVIQPLYGSLMGGTRLTIAGTGFPVGDSSMIDVKVGNTNCEKETVTSSQIICQTNFPGTVHKVTNLGTHPKYGTGYAWKPAVLTVKEGDIVQWVWAVPDRVEHQGYQVIQTPNITSNMYKEGGFRSGQKLSKGSFTHKFTVSDKTYYYWSGFVDERDEIDMKGVIKVLPLSSNIQTLSVMVADYAAFYTTDSGAKIIPEISTNTSMCSMHNIEDFSQMGGFNFTALDCLTTVVDEIWPNELRLDEFLYLRGSGFSTNTSENEVKIGSSSCIVIQSSESEIKCVPDIADELVINTRLPVSLRINKQGNAKINIDDNILNTVVYKPYFDNITPNAGSLAGGTYITITGAGFPTQSNTLQVSLSGESCMILNVTYVQIVCETGMHTESVADVEVSLTVNGFVIPINCTASNCSFQYTNAVTTEVTAITPVSLSGLTNTLTFSGDFQLVTLNNIDLNIGDYNCTVNTLSNNSISCEIVNLPTGSHQLQMRINPHGLASISTDTAITVSGALSSVSPNIGSLNGGTTITISGSVFAPSFDETTVNIGSGNVCLIESVSSDAIVCVTPMVAISGIEDIIVDTNGNTITGNNMFEYSDAATPIIASISPDTASTGGILSISGSGFSTNLQDNMVQIGNHSCTPTGSPTSSLIQCNFDDIIANTYAIGLLVEGVGLSTTDGIQFTFQPSITTIYPTAGSFGGGQLVTISGNGFDSNYENMIITICSKPCHVYNSSVEQILCMTPNDTGSGSVSCDVSVSVNALTDTLSSAFIYEDSKTPVISSVNPQRAGTGGGTRVTIIGERFGYTASDIHVTVAESTCIVNTNETNSTYIVCVTEPSSKTLKTKINLQIRDYGMASQKNADFEYIDVWSSIWTWGGTSLPIEGDIAVIRSGQTVLLDTDTPVLKILLIQGGSLIFDRKDVELNAEYILVTNGGLFQVGTEEEPFMQQANIKLHGHWRTKELPVYGGKVLAVREGTLDLHGRPTPITWTHLSETASAGTAELVLQKPVNWLPGDLVVIPSTGHRHSQGENELREILSVSQDGLTLTLNESLEYSHISEAENINGILVELRGEVGLLSHTIHIQGSNDAQWHDKIEACPDGFNTGEFTTQTCFQGRFGDATAADGYGAHVMLHTPAPNMGTITARIEYVQLNFVGQEFRLGRYPIHYHLLGEMSGSYVRGCGIHQSFNRAVNIHGTHNVLIEHNVIYDIQGGAYFLEDGIETGNIFQYNLATFVKASSSLLNDDITPACFWITNPNNTIRHNAAAGGTHFGFWYRMHKHPDGPSFTTSICPQKVPLGEFYNNTAHSMGWFGLWIFQDYYPTQDGGCSSTNSAPAIFKNLKAWHCEKGAEWVDVSNVQFDNFHMIRNEFAGIEMKMIKNSNAQKFQPDGARITNSLVVGHTSTSSQSECTQLAIILPFNSGLTVENVTFINFDRNCQVFGVTSIAGKCTTKCGGWHYQTKGLVFHNAPNYVKWRWEHEGVIEDLDGSLTGTANAKVIPSSGLLSPLTCDVRSEFSLGVDGSVCQPSVTFTRFAFNHADPPSLIYKNAIFTNEFGSSSVPWLFKRLTHKEGWMLLMPTAQEYEMIFENAGHITNVSYDGVYYELREQDHIVITKNLSIVPDIVTIKPGERRPRTQSMVTYSNSIDGDWYIDELTNRLSYLISDQVSISSRRKRSVGLGIKDSAVNIQVQKCYYTDCILPRDPLTEPPLDSRPERFYLWSNVDTWLVMGLDKPVDGDSVTIKKGYWVVADEPLPRINNLYIYGTLEFEYGTKDNSHKYHDFDLHVDYIIVKGGRLIAGWPTEGQHFQGQLTITLYGTHSTPEMRYGEDEEGPALGSKGMAVFGGLDLHGTPYDVQWTTLTATAEVGSNQLNLEHEVDWIPGSQVIVTTTSYNPWQTEVHTIQTIAGNSRKITLTDQLVHRHLGETYNIQGVNASSGMRTSYKVAAKVGLLTRNIRIVGAEYGQMTEEAFGARVIVGVMADDESIYKGFARLSNVEFFHTGQEGYTAIYDPRFSLAFLSVGDINEIRPSRVSECSFHHGFSTAIGVIGTNKLMVEDNVIYETVSDAVRIEGNDNSLVRNLISLVLWPGSYNGRRETENFDYPSGVEAKNAVSLKMRGNVVTGSERVGYSIPGESCETTTLYSNNEAHGVLTGVAIFSEFELENVECLKISSFIIHKAWDFGIYFQVTPNVIVSDSLLVDNGLGIYSMVLKPAAMTHIKEDKVIEISNSILIATSPNFDCENDVLPQNTNAQLSGQSRSFKSPTGGKIGFTWPVFQSSVNAAPRKPWMGIISYPTIGGLMVVRDVHLSSFEMNHCNRRDVVVSPSAKNDDGSHPVYTEHITIANVDHQSKVFIHRPNVAKINPSDCVDMDCDGMKKVLLKDLDGSFLENGISGAVIPQSEFEWDGDRRRGLGDYRIPKVMLTDLDGTRISVESIAPDKGVIRNDQCQYNDIWQGYQCDDLDYEMLIIESLDADTEKRRLSPVAILGDGYLDLINGPQDHGWCDGYTCKERISTFMALVATEKYYDVYFSSTNPQRTRFYLLNSDYNQAVRLAVFYTNPQRLDVYLNGNYIMPNNMDLDQNNDLVFKNPSNHEQYIPIQNSSSGENYYDRDLNLQYIMVRGSEPVDIVISPVIVIAFNVPPMTIDDFFGDNLVNNLALFLGVDSSRVRVVNIVREGSGRKKRSTGDMIEVEISEPPMQSIATPYGNETDNATAETRSKMIGFSEKIVTNLQLNLLDDLLNITILGLEIEEPLPDPSDPEWQNVADKLDSGEVSRKSVKIPQDMISENDASGGIEGSVLNTVPILKVMDSGGEQLKLLGSTVSPWEVTARLVNTSGSDPRATLLGG